MKRGRAAAGKTDKNSASRTAFPDTWCAINPVEVAAPATVAGAQLARVIEPRTLV